MRISIALPLVASLIGGPALAADPAPKDKSSAYGSRLLKVYEHAYERQVKIGEKTQKNSVALRGRLAKLARSQEGEPVASYQLPFGPTRYTVDSKLLDQVEAAFKELRPDLSWKFDRSHYENYHIKHILGRELFEIGQSIQIERPQAPAVKATKRFLKIEKSLSDRLDRAFVDSRAAFKAGLARQSPEQLRQKARSLIAEIEHVHRQLTAEGPDPSPRGTQEGRVLPAEGSTYLVRVKTADTPKSSGVTNSVQDPNYANRLHMDLRDTATIKREGGAAFASEGGGTLPAPEDRSGLFSHFFHEVVLRERPPRPDVSGLGPAGTYLSVPAQGPLTAERKGAALPVHARLLAEMAVELGDVLHALGPAAGELSNWVNHSKIVFSVDTRFGFTGEPFTLELRDAAGAIAKDGVAAGIATPAMADALRKEIADASSLRDGVARIAR
jgi:hypothetical protein